ncbi:MAG: helix-turn-helix domain-containing protein [Oscillospiraceae bacterium]|nr:helix-turn-helix domain-containing protein [Oscillospiraceae bacterium]
MEYDAIIQSVLDDIDRKIMTNVRIEELARAANYSVYHFCRVFMSVTGTSVSAYITRRRLEHALYELSKGGRIIDVAMEYGFETHAGFTKAFKKYFGYPPSLYRLHMPVKPPERVAINNLKLKHGGIILQVKIKEMQPFTVIGYASRHRMPGVKGVSDIPAFYDTANMEYAAGLTTLSHTYTKSRHCEVIFCLDIDEEHDCFTYVIGVGVDEADYDIPQRPGTYRHEMQGGLYAVFTTPWADDAESPKSIQETWKQILEHWLPKSQYEYDDTRIDYEYHDERAHSWMHDGKAQVDICVPIRLRG